MNFRAILSSILFLVCSVSIGAALDIALPTSNDTLFAGKPEQFYMYVNRWVDGTQTAAWEGGQYGFVRNPRKTPQGILYTRFHEGMDIRPLQRDAQGNPLDTIHAIAAGRVVYTSPEARASNFGRYLVIEHRWDGCPYYSLYAHLSDIYVVPGTEVAKGDKIALMGYTGRGIDRERAHLHLEIGLMLNEYFDTFSGAQWGGGSNRHGVYNGMNLRGLDVARLFTESRGNPALTIPEFLSKEEAFFRVDLPGTHSVDLLRRYPWMEVGSPANRADPPLGWRIFFSQSGIPLRMHRLNEPVSNISVTVEKKCDHPLRFLTCGLVSSTGNTASLTSHGKEFIALLTHMPTVTASNPPLPIGERTHKVRKGETLYTIASDYKVAMSELERINRLNDPALLKSGRVLMIPNPSGASKR